MKSFVLKLSQYNSIKSNQNKSLGFSLIELMTVVAIISILSIISMALYTNVQKDGRDARRQADIRTIQGALEMYYADQFTYPTSITFGSALKGGTGNNEKTYLTTVPTDPGSGSYLYTSNPLGCSTNCTSYCLFAVMEKTSNTAPTGCTPSGSYNFTVTKP